MATRYYVNEESPSPLVLRLRRTDGSIFDLTDYDNVVVEGDGLPPGATSVIDAPEGLVQRDFDSGFVSAGIYLIRARLDEAGHVDYTDVAELPVWDPSEPLTLIITPAEVEAVTGVAVSVQDIARAQSQISLATGRNLSDAEWFASLSANDQFWLKQAVAWQSVKVAEESSGTAASIPVVPGATSIANGDLSISFSESMITNVYASIASNAKLALRNLSWMRSFRSVTAEPFLTQRYVLQPSPWQLVSTGGRT